MRDTGTSDADCFLALLKPIERDLETYCRRLVWEPLDAPDAIQNAVLRAFAAFDRYHEDASFRAWMFKILTHEAFQGHPLRKDYPLGYEEPQYTFNYDDIQSRKHRARYEEA